MAILLTAVSVPCAVRAAQLFEHQVYSFQGGSDGALPYAGVLAGRDGTFFGTTVFGGVENGGTVYKLTVTSKGYIESVLYSFGSRSSSLSDGFNPYAGVVEDGGGALYGTTMNYGASSSVGYGSVYKLTPTASGYVEQILWAAYEMGSGAGAYPLGAVTMDSGGNLYTTNSEGGTSLGGNVLKFTPFRHSYKISVLHAFGATSGDGSFPAAGLTLSGTANHALYGTTESGGASSQCGTIYALTPLAGKYTETVLHRFSGADGCNPEAALVADRSGNLYGTTVNGGLSTQRCCGTVFELESTGSSTFTYKMLYAFQGGSDGAQPMAALLVGPDQNVLYGTTLTGGAGYGTVFELKRSGTQFRESVLGAFGGYPLDGANPRCSLTLTKHGLLGTTAYGGYPANLGTVFTI